MRLTYVGFGGGGFDVAAAKVTACTVTLTQWRYASTVIVHSVFTQSVFHATTALHSVLTTFLRFFFTIFFLFKFFLNIFFISFFQVFSFNF